MINANPKLLVTLPKKLKETLAKVAAVRNCSQAEIVRAALYQHLRKELEAAT